jgi:hypothetical protein
MFGTDEQLLYGTPEGKKEIESSLFQEDGLGEMLDEFIWAKSIIAG